MERAYIWAWGKMTGSFGYYIKRQIDKANADNAPEKAVYFDTWGNRWVTLDECCEKTRKWVEDWVKEYGKRG